MTLPRWLGVIGVIGPAALVSAQGQGAVFRAATDVVTVDVNVQDGRNPVAGLTAADFQILDNGVAQVVTGVSYGRLPIDLRLVFDTSGSISDDELKRYLQAMTQVTESLQPADRCDIIAFSSRIVDVAALQTPPVTIDLQRIEPNATSFFDAVSLSLITAPVSGRRQLTIVMSDADDNSSFFGDATLIATAKRSDAVVYAVVPGSAAWRGRPDRERTLKGRLNTLAETTGGRVIAADRDIAPAFQSAIEEFRRSYVVVYTATGVGRGGWHELKVSLPRSPSLIVRARQGYMGTEVFSTDSGR
jgi:VWFA-related protein